MSLLISFLLSSYLTRVIADLARRAERVADGDSRETLETWTKSELGDLAAALEKMRRKLEGKAYVEEMASTLSHELKTPLSAIRGATDIIESNPEARVRFLDNIRAEVDRMTRIVDDLLALSRIESGAGPEPEEISLPEIAREIAGIYGPRAEMAGIAFSSEVLDAADRVLVAPEELRRVFCILLDNAIQFTPRGGRILLRASGREFAVGDSGCGIEVELLPKVFGRFFTTPNPVTGRRGTGLGLAIAQSIVRRAGGEISIESRQSQGTVVTVRFTEIS